MTRARRLSLAAVVALVLLVLSPSRVSADAPLLQAAQLSQQAFAFYQQRRYAEAEPILRQALAIRERVLGADNPEIAPDLNNLAFLTQAQGRNGEAEALYRRAARILEKALGPADPRLMASLNGLAELYQAEGRYREAEALQLRLLPIRQKAQGPESRNVGATLSELGFICWKQGRYAEAERSYRRALAVLRKTLAPEHPDIVVTQNNLAQVYSDWGHYGDAEPLFLHTLAIREKTLGPMHPDVAVSLNNLAELYRAQSRYREAEPLYRRALTIDEKAFGPADRNVATILSNLGLLDLAVGHYAEAETLLRRALSIREKALGPADPDVALSLNNLGGLLEAQGRYGEAGPLYMRALAIWQKSLGPDNPLVVKAQNNLAGLYVTQGRYTEAEPLFRDVLAKREKLLGPTHPDVAASLNNLVVLYRDQGRYDAAEPLARRALAIREQALGAEHPDVAQSAEILAEILDDTARYDAAEPLYQRALAIWQKKFGPDHPDVGKAMDNLAAMYWKQRRYQDAEALDRRALAISESHFGPDHPATATDLGNLATTLAAQGHGREAEPLLKRALAIREKAFGPDHPDVAASLSNLAELYSLEGTPAAALPFASRAVEIVARHIAAGNGRSSATSLAERRKERNYFTAYIREAYAAMPLIGQAATTTATFRVVQLAQASSTAQAVVGTEARLAAGSDALASVVRERQDLAARWQDLDTQIVKASSKPPDKRDATEEQALHANIDGVAQRLDTLDARIAHDFPGYAELSNPQPVSLDATEHLLADDEALLVYLVSGDASWLWVVRHDGATFHQLALGTADLTREVTALRANLDPERNQGEAPFPAIRAYALYQALIAPVAEQLAGIHHLLLVPDGALQSLPLAVLPTQPPKQDPRSLADHRSIAWLAREYAVTVLPSVSSLQALRRPGTIAAAPAPFLGIGDPVLQGVTLAGLFRGSGVDVEKVRSLPPLPETADELREIAHAMGASDADLLLGERASEPVLRRTPLDRYRMIAFATHGLLAGELPGLSEPALVLTPPAQPSADNDGLLTASKIATLKLNADWVVLSACNTAAGDGSPNGDGLSGLARAFFYAGARSLLVSHWPVMSKAAVMLTTGAFTDLASDPSIGRAEALRRAMMSLLDPASPPELAHPMAWAPYILVGG